MRKTTKFIALLAIALIAFSVACSDDSLNPPRYYESDGVTSLWQYEMSVLEQATDEPYRTQYGVFWNGYGLSIDDTETAGARWIQFVFWNGHGIESIEVYEVATGQLIYPSDTDPTRQVLDSKNGIFVSVESWSYQSDADTLNSRYIITNVSPPQEEETQIRVRVTDGRGNVTSDVIDIASISILR